MVRLSDTRMGEQGHRAIGTVSEGEGLLGIHDDLTGQDILLVKRALEWAERTGNEPGKVLPPPCFEAWD